ncbi:MAG: hypothetical protein AB1861_06935 [Cyanobacteriota bacterium]
MSDVVRRGYTLTSENFLGARHCRAPTFREITRHHKLGLFSTAVFMYFANLRSRSADLSVGPVVSPTLDK